MNRTILSQTKWQAFLGSSIIYFLSNSPIIYLIPIRFRKELNLLCWHELETETQISIWMVSNKQFSLHDTNNLSLCCISKSFSLKGNSDRCTYNLMFSNGKQITNYYYDRVIKAAPFMKCILRSLKFLYRFSKFRDKDFLLCDFIVIVTCNQSLPGVLLGKTTSFRWMLYELIMALWNRRIMFSVRKEIWLIWRSCTFLLNYAHNWY